MTGKVGCIAMLPARETLTIVANGEIHAGVIAYGLRSAATRVRANFPFHAWPEEISLNEGSLHGQAWEVLLWEIQIDRWPERHAWKDAIKETLADLVDAGAVVAWLGSEGHPYVDPPDLFKPEHMTGGVLAALTKAGEFWSPFDPDMPAGTLSDDDLLRLRAASKGLSDTS
jgi:hypothetical protein